MGKRVRPTANPRKVGRQPFDPRQAGWQKVKTYRQMLEALLRMSDTQLDSDITVYNLGEDEFYPSELRVAGDDGVLDRWHPVIFNFGDRLPVSDP